ncbi:MAG: T9SS type A sorting domain-containing protein, partial [Calditrichaeota bacterium]|nr:T9SS type A sorting domain-containing protein [Calditrichota bacterium]
PTARHQIPQDFNLINYPNPFNNSTTIEFSLPESGFVTLKIYNLLGQETATIVSAKLVAGNYQYRWNASSLASGIYYYRLESGGFQQANKMILLK